MRSLSKLDVVQEDFRCRAVLDGRCLTLHLAGNADMQAHDLLQALLVDAHTEAWRLMVKEVAVNLRELDFMNSSCFKCLVTWINRVQSSEPSHRYQIRFVTKHGVYWQRRGVESLKHYADEVVVIGT